MLIVLCLFALIISLSFLCVLLLKFCQEYCHTSLQELGVCEAVIYCCMCAFHICACCVVQIKPMAEDRMIKKGWIEERSAVIC